MKKTILQDHKPPATSSGNDWLSSDAIAEIAVSSEPEDAPVENVLDSNCETGWRAGVPGPQLIRITFSRPINIRRIQLLFRERHFPRTQEFTLRCTVAGEQVRELVRQQWTFSPQGSTEELEDYALTLEDAVELELAIIPDISGAPVHASLVRLRVG